jgi:uncharacterized membrane protein YidH (DUF202 family)
MIGHHATLTSISIELAIVVGLVALFGAVAWRERRRRARREHERPVAGMRDGDHVG